MHFVYPLLFGLLLVTTTLSAQDWVLRGKVFDAQKNIILPFATLGIAGKIGTVSNENGEFELLIPQNMRGDSLIVSSIGYYSQTYALIDLEKLEAFNAYLQPRSYFLNEVAVLKARLSAEEIVQKAFNRIDQNYLTQAFSGDGFYREYFKENGQYAAFAEAALSIYDIEGYKRVPKKSYNSTKCA